MAQKQLFENFSPKMLSTCRQYIKDLHDAEDVMLCGFMKVFQNIEQYRKECSFEGWIRIIMIRESISFLRAKKENTIIEEAIQSVLSVVSNHQEFEYNYHELIDESPNGSKYVLVISV